MGGKRSDQHNFDPGEAGSSDEHIADEQKQHLQSNPHDQPMIPQEGVNPVARELRERKEAAQGGDRGGMSADERVDEASDESFPASDPPAQP